MLIPPLDEDLHRKMWQAIADIYGVRFTSSFGTDPMGPAGKRWRRALAGFTPEMIAHGLHVCESSVDGWILLPLFKARCMGIPEFHSVALALSEPKRVKTRFDRLVWQNLPGGGHTFRNQRPERQDMLLRQAYMVSVEHVMRGGQLPPAVAGEIEVDLSWRRDPNAPRDLIKAAEEMKRAREFLGLSDDEEPASGPRVTPVADDESTRRSIADMTDEVLAIALMARADRKQGTPDCDSEHTLIELAFNLEYGPQLSLLRSTTSVWFRSRGDRQLGERVYFDLQKRFPA